MSRKINPLLVYSDDAGNVFDHDCLRALGASGEAIVDILPEEWIPLPEGSRLMRLPGRFPVGRDPETGEIVVLESDDNESIMAVAAFVAPAYTIMYHAVYECSDQASRLPLYAYSAVGWYEGRFYVPAIRIDESIRQDPAEFDMDSVDIAAKTMLSKYPQNRLVRHLVENCALRYGCPAALNYLLNRWEMPLPTSRVCTSNCLGCISLQENTGVCSAQLRIDFTPTAYEIIEIAVDHLKSAPEPVVSFGQGCEGEPLMNADLLINSVKGIRKKTKKGTIHLNTNASRPEAVAKLRQNGLDSMRVSLNSTREDYYNRYFRQKGYSFADVLKSIELMKSDGGFVSLNLFVFPGFTDQPDEIESLEKLIDEYHIDMIQWRNLNIDPDWYRETMQPVEQDGIGIAEMIAGIRVKFPELRHGYFNPYLKK